MADRHKIFHVAVIVFLLLCAAATAFAASPGDACPAAGAVERDGGQTLICNGTVWKEAEQIANTGRSKAQVDNDTGNCTADKTGRLRYNESTDTWEYCAGTGPAWNPFEDPLCEDDDTGECRVEVDRSDNDPEFIAANVKDGVNILGVTGTYSGGCLMKASVTPPANGNAQGCITGDNLTWTTISCVSASSGWKCTFGYPLVDGHALANNNPAKEFWCNELGGVRTGGGTSSWQTISGTADHEFNVPTWWNYSSTSFANVMQSQDCWVQ